MAGDRDTVVHKLTRADAVEMIKKAPTGTRFAVHIRGDAPVADNDDQCYAGRFSSSISISRKDAMRIAGEGITAPLEEKGARIRLSVYTWESGTLGNRVTYWLGG
jgi:hypothetical protein